MLNLAICDDMPDQLSAIVTFIKEYTVINAIDSEIHQYTHPNALLVACEINKYHIYVLDIVMPMMSGIEVGKEIRRLDRDAQIIFASTEPSFALEAFSANPINYLIKPVDKLKLFETLDLAISKVNTSEERIITVKTKEGLRVIELSSIIFCEYKKHTAEYTLMGGEIVTTLSTKEPFSKHIEPILIDARFIQPHISFVVNMSRIESFSKAGFVMRGGAMIPIAAKQYPTIRDLYMDYLLSREGFK